MQISKMDIDSNVTVKNCKKCNGTGTIIIHDGKARPTKSIGRTVSFSRAVLCECRRNELVENTYPMLGNKKIPKIASGLAEKFASVFPLDNNYRFTGNLEQFMLIMKAVFVHHRRSSKFMGYISNGLEMILDYYVAQPKDVQRRFQDLTHEKDLVVILCNTRVSNSAVGPGVVELVQSRLAVGKPTWVFTPHDFDESSEYTSELVSLLGSDFRTHDIKPAPKRSTNDVTRGVV